MRCLCIAITWACAHAAFAEVSKEDAARATALFDAGQAAIEAGRIEDACSRFEQSLALDPQVGTRLNLADCRERQGRLIEAYTLYDYSAVEAEQTNKPGRLTFARKQLDRLAAALVRITLRVTDDSPGLTLTLTATGTRELPRAVWSRTVMAEPGPFTIHATAPDRKPVTLERAGTAGSAVEVEIPRLESTIQAPPPPPPSPTRWPRVPIVIGGAGIVLLGTGLVLAVTAKGMYDDASTDAENDAARSRAVLATGVSIVGAIGASVGIVLFVRARRAGQVVVTPTTDGTTTGVSIRGAF